MEESKNGWIKTSHRKPTLGQEVWCSETSEEGVGEEYFDAIYQENRRCMLAGIAGGNGYFPEAGFATSGASGEDRGLILDEPPYWKPKEEEARQKNQINTTMEPTNHSDQSEVKEETFTSTFIEHVSRQVELTLPAYQRDNIHLYKVFSKTHCIQVCTLTMQESIFTGHLGLAYMTGNRPCTESEFRSAYKKVSQILEDRAK